MKLRSFGIEMECFVPREGDETEQETRDRVARCIQERTGVQIQTEDYNHTVHTGHWKIITDSSIVPKANCVGMELVSPVLRYNEGARQVRLVCGVLAELRANVNKTCGLHVHHGARCCKRNHMQRAIRFYAVNEFWFDKLVAPSRRGNENNYCRTLDVAWERWERDSLGRWGYSTVRYADVLAKRLTRWENLLLPETGGANGRYHKVNMHSFAKYGTIEIRHHQGTVEADKILAWTQFFQAVLAIFHYDVPIVRYETFADFMAFVGTKLAPETRLFLAERAEKLNPGDFEVMCWAETLRRNHAAAA